MQQPLMNADITLSARDMHSAIRAGDDLDDECLQSAFESIHGGVGNDQLLAADDAYSAESLGAVVYHLVPADYELTAEDVESILARPDLSRLATHPPIEPVGGHLYLFDTSGANAKELRRELGHTILAHFIYRFQNAIVATCFNGIRSAATDLATTHGCS
jgi:hypothetical protein